MSRGSNERSRERCSPNRRDERRDLRRQLVRQAGCMHSECREMARELLADTEWMATGDRGLIRIPRSLRQTLACVERTVEQRVNDWHRSASKLPLHEYLGMTEHEYSVWVTGRML